MALFPKCSFQVLVPGGVIVAGNTLDGILELTVPEEIPRAERVVLVFRSNAWVGYGSGKSRNVVRRGLLELPVQLELPDGVPLARGTHRYPFQLDIPAWLPPRYKGPDCAIEHTLEARLDVEWAIDPVTRTTPEVVLPPAEAHREPAVVRSPDGFHESLMLEVALASKVVAQGEPLTGTVALRSGHEARFDAVLVSCTSLAIMSMGRADRRQGDASTVRIPAERLRSGESVPFVIPPQAAMPPTFSNGYIDHDVVLQVSVDIPWAFDPSFQFPIALLPEGSTIHGSETSIAVGGERLRQIAAAMAEATGLAEGVRPALVEGPVGPVDVRIADAGRAGRLGIDVSFHYPDVELGIVFRRFGVLDGFRDSALLPEGLRADHLLRFEPEGRREKVDEEALAPFVSALLDDLGSATRVRVTDYHLALHVALPDDDVQRMVDVARFARDKAEAIGKAIERLPFPTALAASSPAWKATAREHGALVVPTGPSIHRLVFAYRLLGGEEREFDAAIRTTWDGEEPATRVDLHLGAAPLPKAAYAEVEKDSDRLRHVRAVFPQMQAWQSDRVSLERPGFTADPRRLIEGIELFLAWVLEARGERRAVQAYR